MSKRRVHAEGTYAHYVTFSCYKRRHLLGPDHCKKVVIGALGNKLRHFNGVCAGFVVMPDHVHSLDWFPEEFQISGFMDKWKEVSSKSIEGIYARQFPNYNESREAGETVWQDRYY